MKNKETFGFPMVYYAIATFIGALCYMLYNENKILALTMVFLFIIIMLLTIDLKDFIIVTIFVILAIFSSYVYFDGINLGSRTMEFRITEKKEYSIYGKSHNRLVLLKGIDKEAIEDGDKILVKGKFKKAPKYERGVLGEYYIEAFEVLPKDFYSRVLVFKKNYFIKLNNKIGGRKAAMVMALALGDESYITKGEKQELKELGIVHAISVSGLHMALIYKVLSSFILKDISLVLSIIFIVLTGFKASAIRSYIMLFLGAKAIDVKQVYNPLVALCFSAVILILLKPYNIYSAGFHLSFLGVLGILLFNNKLNKKLYRINKYMREALALSISAQIFTFPYIAMVFGEGNISFILGNLLLVPLLSIVVILGNLAFIFYKFSSLFLLICFPIEIVLNIYDFISYILLKLSPPIMEMVYLDGVLYIALITVVILLKKGYYKFKYFPVVIFIFIFAIQYNLNPHVSYLKIGWNHGILIQYKGESVLIGKNAESVDRVKNVKGLTNKIESLNKEEVTLNELTIREFQGKYKKSKKVFAFLLENKSSKWIITNDKGKLKLPEDMANYEVIEFLENEENFLSKVKLEEYVLGKDKAFKIK